MTSEHRPRKWYQKKRYILLSLFIFPLGISLVSQTAEQTPETPSAVALSEPSPVASIEPSFSPQTSALTKEQAIKLLYNEDDSRCWEQAVAGGPGTENYAWNAATESEVIEAFRSQGQQVEEGSGSGFYDLTKIAARYHVTEGLSGEALAAYLRDKEIPDFQKFYPGINQQTASIAAEVGPGVYLPKATERVKVKCADLIEQSTTTSPQKNITQTQLTDSTTESPGAHSEASTEAVLTADDLNSQINLRDTPSAEGKRRGYGLVGDQVQVLNQTTAEGSTWYQVQFPKSGAVGWIRGDFVSLINAEETRAEETAQTPSEPSTYSIPSTSDQTYTAPTTSTSSSSGTCDHPEQFDSAGRRCGGRAASVRSGGRKRR